MLYKEGKHRIYKTINDKWYKKRPTKGTNRREENWEDLEKKKESRKAHWTSNLNLWPKKNKQANQYRHNWAFQLETWRGRWSWRWGWAQCFYWTGVIAQTGPNHPVYSLAGQEEQIFAVILSKRKYIAKRGECALAGVITRDRGCLGASEGNFFSAEIPTAPWGLCCYPHVICV